MRTNRSIPNCTVLPELPYDDVLSATQWLCQAFGFTERLRIGNHRVQLMVGNGALVVVEWPASATKGERGGHMVMVRVEAVDPHCDRARQAGATILRPTTTYPFGERQYTAQDIGGHIWTFSESVADVDPKDWGGELIASD